MKALRMFAVLVLALGCPTPEAPRATPTRAIDQVDGWQRIHFGDSYGMLEGAYGKPEGDDDVDEGKMYEWQLEAEPLAGSVKVWIGKLGVDTIEVVFKDDVRLDTIKSALMEKYGAEPQYKLSGTVEFWRWVAAEREVVLQAVDKKPMSVMYIDTKRSSSAQSKRTAKEEKDLAKKSL